MDSSPEDPLFGTRMAMGAGETLHCGDPPHKRVCNLKLVPSLL